MVLEYYGTKTEMNTQGIGMTIKRRESDDIKQEKMQVMKATGLKISKVDLAVKLGLRVVPMLGSI